MSESRRTKSISIGIEVDGMAFHKSGSSQANRDAMKDSVLAKAHVPLLRLSTDGSNEKSRIIEKLMQISSTFTS